jgi:cellulose synthase/poly-beta-1,6-N-acetylglucosamine synthase-like glycosyltransferase
VAYAVLLSTALFGILYVRFLVGRLHEAELSRFAVAILGAKTLVEVAASFYAFAYLFNALAYLFAPRRRRAFSPSRATPAIGLLYLCCDDLDEEALLSLRQLDYSGPMYLILHDDSSNADNRKAVDALAESLRLCRRWQVIVLRRPTRTGGKPGAINYVLDRTAHLYEYFLLLDNDSTVVDREMIQKILPYFERPEVAAVQCRPVAVESATYCAANRLLARAIGAFHVILSPCVRFGWVPFIGHNAMLRTSHVVSVGGLTPGFFSDDLDLTVRLNLEGLSVVYASEVLMAEKHPPHYAAFRKRSYKWAFGCMQTLKTHSWAVLTSSRFTLAQKVSFFQFVGFYLMQAVLLVYLVLAFGLAPIVLGPYPVAISVNAAFGLLLILLVYLPFLTYFLKEDRRPGWFHSLALCGLVYGATDFSVARGVWDGIWYRSGPWIPTNSVATGNSEMRDLGEALFGMALLCGPFARFPALLYIPSIYLFAGKFLFGPALSILYDDLSLLL